MTTHAVRADRPETLEEDLACSMAVLRAAGFRCYRLGDQLTPWHLEAVCPWGHVLVHVFRGEWPSRLGVDLFRLPPGWPPLTWRLLHHWTDQPLPEALPLD